MIERSKDELEEELDGEENEDNLSDDYESEEEDLEAVSYVCEDCDYRWEEKTPASVDVENDVMVCPMCGCINVTEL